MQTQTPTLTYWQQHLQYAPTMFALAADKKRQVITDNQLSRYTQSLPTRLNENETAVNHFLASYLLLLRQHIQQDDLIIGTAVANQLLPLRIQVNPNDSFSQFMADVAATCSAMTENALPLTDLVAALQPAYDDSYAPLFQLVFAAAVTEPVEVTEFHHLHDIALVVEKSDAGWHAHWHYRADLFTEAHIERLALQYTALLQNIAQNPDAPIANLSIISADEFELMVHTWNQTELDFPQDLCLHEWIAQQVARTPQKTAVSDENRSLTYAQLDTQSSQLAAYLQQQGVQPGVVVAFYLPRTVSVLVTLLGTLKAGGTYLPLTADLPVERIQFMLDDAQARLIITDSEHVNQLPPDIPTVQLDTQWAAITSMEPLAPEHLPTDTTAYIIYTSGSTGIPKGVPITHRNIVHLLAAMLQEPGMTAADKYLAITAFSFDILGYELYCPLLVGGEVVVASSVMMRDGHLLSERLDQGDITFMQSTPVTWQMLLAAGWQGSPHLKMVSCGEALTRHLATQLLTYGGELWNLYGPTEATIFATGHHVSRAELTELTRDDLPIGRPIANMETYILDENHHLLPIGAVGELYLGGAGLSPGYLYREALTAERFIPHPFAADPSAKLYRTGDLARYRPDGIIEYLGRTDYQVKVHGLRIELGEIESRAQELPEVAASVATTWINPANNDKQLVLYFVSSSGQTIDSNQIRQALRETLPGYMVPNILMQLPKLPATPNGKVDRKALPAPNLDELERSVPFAAPRNPIEAAICAFWQSLLGISSISIHDDFLELGAHSLQATQFISFVQGQFNVKLLFREIIEQGTVARIARLIAEAQPQTAVPPIIPVDPSENIPVSIAQQRLLVLDQLLPNQATYNVPLVLRLEGNLDETALQTAVDVLFARHDSLRTSFFYAQDGQPCQQIATETHLPISQMNLASEKEALDWVKAEVKRPFSLTQDRLIRLSCIRLADEQHIFVIVIHHTITDGWSTQILLDELWQVYRAARQNDSIELPDLPLRYADYALWQRRRLEEDNLGQDIAYWQTYLADAPALLKLPADMPRPKMQSTRGNTFTALLAADLTDSLKQLSRAQSSTLFMTLLTAYSTLLFRHSHQEDLVIGTPAANRNHPEIEKIIGFFVNMLPLRARIQHEDNFLTLLQQVRQSALDAHHYQAVPFEKIVEVLQPTRDTSYSPLFQVAFTFDNANAQLPQLAELDIALLTVEHQTAKYDLTLSVTESEDGLICAWEYCTDLFWPETIARLHDHFAALLRAVVDNPELPVCELPILTETERQTILHEWQGQPDENVPQICLHQQFEAWASRQPEATAVSDGTTTLTYEELNGRANQLARLLIEAGVQPGNPVGIHMQAGVPAITSMLACHKARAAYVPFDPAYPEQRLQLILNDTAAPVILTDTDLEHLDTGNCTVFAWDTIQSRLDEQTDSNLDLPYTPADPAYIIYTSGSTGKPKGVVCGHAGVFNLLCSLDQWGTLPPQTNSSLWTSLNFDVSIYEIFAPLVSGGALHIVPSDVRTNMPLLFAWFAERRIGSVYLPPFMVEPFAAWLREGHRCPELKRLLVGVEPLAEATLVQIMQHIPELVLINGYGPTEATVCATLYRVPEDSTRTGNAPIGRPLLNSQVYLLDEQMQPVPVGVLGELFIGGMGLAHGYLNQPQLTADHFVPDPFSTDPQARLYRSGDLAKYLPDGNIQFYGRTDFQLKVRGFRVELGEIEACLLAQPGVAAAAVTPLTASDGQVTLTAYFVPEANAVLDQHTLQQALQETLPNYMVPAIWMQLDKMPRTPNDKIDRKALPVPNLEDLERTNAFIPPRNAIETRVHAIWQSLLGVTNISIHDNFFMLGGHSLLATQLVSRIHNEFGVALPLQKVFDQGTIAQIGQFITNARIQKALAPIPRADMSQPIPVSFAQQRLLVLEQLTPNQPTYNVPLILQLDGVLDTAVLQASVDALIARHDVLRTSFYYDDDGQPFQRISPNAHLPITVSDLSHLPAGQQEKETEKWMQQQTQQIFSLTDDLLIRVSLLKVAAQQHLLAIVMHHIIIDGWSAERLVQEFGLLYTAFKENKPSPLTPLPIQYADFAVWQRSWLRGNALQEQLAYWKEQLQNIPATLTLPTEHTRPAMQSYEGAIFKSTLPANSLTLGRQLAQEERATLFMVLLTTFQLLLARYTGQEDIVVGSPIANRNHSEIEDLIGFFVNMLVLRANTAGNPTFRDLVRQVRSMTLDAYAHQDIPFEKLVEELQPTRDLSYSPLFQIVFILQNAPHKEVSLPELTLSTVKPPCETAKYDLTLALNETAEGLEAEWEYNAALFEESTIERLSVHFNHLWQQVVNNPDLPIQAVDILTSDEKQQMAQWNRTTRPFPEEACLHQLISQQAARTPQQTAVSDAHTQLTYQQLEERSNQVAHHLLALGVEPDTFVAIALERTVEMMVCLLGILKAGGAYLPMDPAYPAQRIEYMLADTQAPILLTQTSLLSRFPAHNAQLVCIDTEWETISQYPTTLPQTAVRPEHLAYIIYTSGSTGKPKGVQIHHRAVVNLLTDMQHQPGIVAADKLLAITTLSFDIATVELYLPLLVGAQVVIAPQEAQTDPDLLLDLLQKEAITVMQATPTTWQMLLNANWQSQPGLKMITGGEPLTVTIAQQLLARGETLWNMYAPSETTTYSTIQPVLAEDLAFAESVSIGRPVANTQLYILDRHRQQVPIGVTGELYIGGEGVARGYLNQPELTNERFIHHAFDNHEPIRLYATGDLASFRPDGSVNFLGRADHQVKIRGFRIELGEIEACLQQHTAVSQVVVHPYQQQLVAYLIFAEGEQIPPTAELRAFIQETLPAHMMPHIFMPVEAFPKTPNGKIDRRALPAPTTDRESATRFVAPRSATEEQLAQIWQTLLNVDRVGIYDDFFLLGGHSLLATQLVSQIRKAFAVNIPLRKVFEQGTIAGLSPYLAQEGQLPARLDSTEQASLSTIQSRPFPDDKLPLSLSQKRLWFFYKLNPASASYNVPIALRLRGAINSQWLAQSLLDVIQRHEVLRTTYYEADDVYGRIQTITESPITHINLRHLQADEQESKVMQRVEEEGQRPFTLTDEIPIRIQLLELSDDHFVLLLTLHHIAIDLWSVDLLVQEVVAFYKAHQENRAPDLPQLLRQYSDYAAWQEQWLAEHQTAQEAYWQKTLTANSAPLLLPADKPRPAKVTEAGAGFSFQLPDDLSQQTQQFIVAEKATLFMVLLAAYHALLYQYTGEREINVGSPIANRNHTQTDNLLGMFVNTVVINATIDPQMSFRQLLHQVRQRTIGAQENQDIPFNKVVDLVQPERDPAFSPLFQTLFTAQKAGNISTIPGVKLEPITSPTQTAKFDLTLSMTAQSEGISGFIEHKTDLFSDAYMEQFSQHYARLLTEMLQNPDAPLAELDFRTAAECAQQTQAAAAPIVPQSLAERFAEIVAQFGDKTAVSTPTTTLTYQQLDEQSNQIAHLLHQQGIAAGDTIAIYAAATPEMITAVFGILKAGGIYLPLNQDEPAAWQQACLQSGEAKLLLYSQNPPEGLSDFPQIAVETAVSLPITPLPTLISGGIHLPHFGPYDTAELGQLADIYPIQPDSRVVHMAPFASHQAAHEIFATLLNGGTLFLAERTQLTKLSALYELFVQTHADFAILPAALLAAVDPQRVPDLQTAVCLEADLSLTHWQKWAGRQRLHGHLSAASILPTLLSPVNEADFWLAGMPTTAVSIQNEAGQRTPTGVVGELHVGSALQSTGDQWRWLSDGRIQFRRYHPTHTTTYGRYVHTQPIAELLCQNTAVQQCVILPDNNPAEKRQLHAYVVAAQPVETAQLEQFAQQQLPRQLVPAHFHLLAELPRTASGSVDYLALQKMQDQESQSGAQTDARTARQAELAARRDNLSAKKLALLEKWQQQKASTANDTPRIPARPADQPLPLSFAQQRLWFIEQLEATGASYNIPIHMQLNGPLDVAALEFSFNQLLARHESLRTRFVPDEDDVPHQQIVPYTAVSLPLTDLSKLPKPEKETEAEKIRVQNAQTKFDLQNEPVYRIHILRLGDQTHQLLFTVHHIAFDAWSTGIFLREIVTHYLQKTSGRALPLPQVNVQYGDYTLWQQSQLTDDVLAEQLAFWRNHLADAPAAIELPADMPRHQWQTSHGSLYEFDIPPTIAEQVKRWTQTEQATLFMTLLTAFNGLLYRYTNQEDIVVGTPIANRNHPDLKNLIGFFINTLALRAHIEETTTWQELLEQTRQTMLDAQAYQDYPFENLVQALLPDRDPARHPLFQVMFVLQNQGDDAPLPPDLPIRINFVGTETKTAKFDLLLHIEETAVGLAAAFEYNTDLFLPETIARMANHFQQMVADMVTQPEQPIFQAKLLTEREEKQIAAWNDTAMAVDETEMIHHRFERQAAARPDAIAVEFGDEQLTYAELEAQANQLAHFLHQQGIVNNDLVGIMLPRSLAMVTAVLGTLKAGAGYVPLDPVYPPNRLEAMMQQAGVKLLLSHSSLPKPEINCPVYAYDALDLAGYGRTPLQITTNPEQIAYVIFTSGSTGIPKGVTLPHRALANVLAWQQQATHIERPARTLQFTSLSFDVHFQEIFTAWQEGGTLVLIPDDVRRDGEQLLDYIQQHHIERLFLPFVALHNLAEAAEWQQSYPHSLQEVITAGEALQSTPPVRQFFTELSHCVLHNHYGPSESHVVTQYTLGADPAQWAALPPIGTPVANTQIHLLDANMKPVPIGIPGELYIGGRNLALGYINQPDLTKERFIPDPFGSSQTGLLYKTGDLARYLPDGNIQFIGRNDFQVKIRGHRIELGEIEAVLNKHTAVEQAVVQAHKPDIGAHQLIAYIKTAQEDVIATLPAYLRERLPAYMVPAHFVRLDAFPLTSSGKINRRALPVPDKMEVVRSMPYTAPETDLQETLVQVWEEVLSVSPVGIHDNFFELGGHSLLALRLVTAMKKATGVKLPLPRLFQEGTIAAIAAYLDNPTAQTSLSPVVTLRSGDAEQPPLVLIHPGSGQVTPYLPLIKVLPDSLPVYALQSLGLLPDTAAQTDIETMAATYLQELTAVSVSAPYHLAGWSMGGLVALEMAQQLTASGIPPASLTLIDTFAPDGKFTAPNDSVLLQWFAQDAGYLTPGDKPSLLADEVDINAQLRHLWPQLQATGNIPPALNLADVQQQFAVFRTNYAAMQAYQPQRYPLPVHLIVAKASARSVRDKWLGWKSYLPKRSRLMLSAAHFSLLHPPHIQRIAQEILKTLQESSEVRR